MRAPAPAPAPAALSEWFDAAWSWPVHEESVEVEGALIAARGWSLDRPELPGLLLVHGYQAHARWWDHIAPWFADRYRVIAVDLTGFGDSAHRPGYSRAQHGRELIGIARAFDLDRPTLVGHSYGAIVSLAACHATPDVFTRAILIEPWLASLEGDDVLVPPATNRMFPDLAAALARYRLLPSDGWPHPRLLGHVARHSFRETDEGWRFKFDDRTSLTLNTDESAQPFRTVSVPLDFVHGDRTDVVDPDLIARVQEILPACAPPVRIPLAHHHAMLEQPVAFVAALEALLAHPRGWADVSPTAR